MRKGCLIFSCRALIFAATSAFLAFIAFLASLLSAHAPLNQAIVVRCSLFWNPARAAVKTIKVSRSVRRSHSAVGLLFALRCNDSQMAALQFIRSTLQPIKDTFQCPTAVTMIAVYTRDHLIPGVGSKCVLLSIFNRERNILGP